MAIATTVESTNNRHYYHFADSKLLLRATLSMPNHEHTQLTLNVLKLKLNEIKKRRKRKMKHTHIFRKTPLSAPK